MVTDIWLIRKDFQRDIYRLIDIVVEIQIQILTDIPFTYPHLAAFHIFL